MPGVPRTNDPRNFPTGVVANDHRSPMAAPFGSQTRVASGQNQKYTVTLGAATAGNFTLNPNGQGNTANIPYNSTPAAVQTALEAVVGAGNVAVTGSNLPGGTVTIEFIGNLAEQAVTLTANFAGVTGGTPTLTSTQTGTGDAYGVAPSSSYSGPTNVRSSGMARPLGLGRR